MREKENTNLKTKINLKNYLVNKPQQPFNLQSINIQTINKNNIHNYFNEDKKFSNIKFPNKLKYLNNTTYNNNIGNNYLLNDDQISFFSFYNNNKEPSPINSLNSSLNSTYTQKKGNYKRLQKRNKHKYHLNVWNSINYLSLNSKNNTNQSVSLNSSSSSSYKDSSNSSDSSSNSSDFSDSSDVSYRSLKNRRKNYLELMMAEEENSDYLKRREVGLVSSDEEENNNSIDNNNASEESLNNEIERILIEIYNKNISIISSGNYPDMDKSKREFEDVEKQIKKFLKKKNLKTNLLVLKCLSNKIKELVGKYKEKVLEIDEIKNVYNINKQRKNLLRSNQIFYSNNSVGSNVATNSNSSYDSNLNDEEIVIKNNIINIQDEIAKNDILLRELINIKKTLKISSKEIKRIFRYPLHLLKDENGKKMKFSVELMQTEEFCKTLLNDEFISFLLNKMKEGNSQLSISDISRLIEEVEKDCDHKNEMTRFVNYINDKLGIKNENNKNYNNNNYSDEYGIKENYNNNYEEQIGKNIPFREVDAFSTTEGNNYKNGKNIRNANSNISEYEEYCKNTNSNSNKNSKKKKNNNNEDDKNNENNIMNFKDIDELLNYINEESDSKKGKKRGKKNRKNKKQNNSSKEKEDENKYSSVNKEINNNDNNYKEKDGDFEKIFNEFKNDIEKNSVYMYDINKIEPCLTTEFINNKCNI